MNKFKQILLYIIVAGTIGILSIVLPSSYRKALEPEEFYKVYLDGNEIGVVSSKRKLEDYIDKNNEKYKKLYNVSRVYSPNGLEIEKVLTYDGKVNRVEDIYDIIQKEKPFTIKGYKFTIVSTVKNKNDKDVKSTKTVYVTKKSIFDESVINLFKTYAGTDRYNLYINNEQEKIVTTGTYINNIYLDDNITIKETNIPVTETIYSDTETLSQFLLFGKDNKKTNYIVRPGDTISTVAFDNKISVEEFLLSNTQFSSENNLLFPGQKVVINATSPQLQVVIEQSVTKDQVKRFNTVERYDESRQMGDDRIIQKGENGLERISQETKSVNGVITYVKPVSKKELKPSTDRIIVYGQKQVSGVGSTASWGWPTNSGYTISSNYGYRYAWGRREFHLGIDIAGTGYGSPVYAVNNGTIMDFKCHWSYGNCLLINHNNGYYTLYAHMSRIKGGIRPGVNVSRGQVIAYVGQTGSASGPHLHFEVYMNGMPYTGGTRVSPWVLYK